ncbi:MAG: sugar transferase [candidate division Zixibacteria bacterium]|nr:sugar transferase [candidate division Zixibacteria bacterium]
MLRDKQNLWRRLNLLGDLILTSVALSATFWYFKPAINSHVIGLIYSLTIIIWAISLYGPAGSYFYRMKSRTKIFGELLWSISRAGLAFVAILFFADIALPNEVVFTFFAINGALLVLFRFSLSIFLSTYRIRGKSNRNMLIIGTGERAKDITDKIEDNRHWGLHILGFLDYKRTGLWRYRDIPLIGHPDGLAKTISMNQVDYIIIAVENGDLALSRHAFAIGEEMGVTVCFMSDFYYHPISKASSTNFLDFPAVVYSSEPTAAVQLTMKNAIDWLGGIVGTLVSIPVGLAAAIAIKFEDGGPVFFKQTRSGKNGKPFTIYKFRTMVKNAEELKKHLEHKNEMSGPVFKMTRDPRVTRVGSFLRKTSIDELPQFINILKGDMSLVGPRPPLPKEVMKYDRWQRRKLAVKPGLTCLWQINGRNDIDFEDWMKLDLEYIDNWSLWLDTKILAKTVPTVLKGNGAS